MVEDPPFLERNQFANAAMRRNRASRIQFWYPNSEEVLCEPTSFQALFSPTTSFPTTPRNVASFPNCKDNIPWFSCLAAEVFAPRIAGKRKGSFNSIASSRSPIAGLSPLAPTISPQTNEYRTGVGAHWPFLSDAGRVVQKDLDIAEYTDPTNNPMIPHVIVLEPGLVIYKIYNGYWFFGRPTLEELRQDLRAVTKKCRPDWDITTPELKAAWKEGRKDLFYPYGKTYAQTLGEQD